MDTVPYARAFDRIRAEYLEMPGMRLTPTQVQRLSGVEISVCRVVLEDLVRAKFLWVAPDGSYLRVGDGCSVGPRMTKPYRPAGLVPLASRRAS